jgi:serine/threonine protein kinase
VPRVYKPGDVVESYTVVKEINRGMMALSYQAKDFESQTVFFKQYKSPTVRVPWYYDYIDYQKEMKRRIETSVCQNFCYRFLDAFEYDRCFFQVFEYLDRSLSLEEILDRCRRNRDHVAPEQRLIMAKVLLSGIAALHGAGIVHSDLKPENIMLIKDASIAAGYRLRVIDMDFALLQDREAPWHGDRGYFGTVGYLSPEHLRGEVPEPASDVFTLGLILHELLGGAHPYRAADEAEYRKRALGHEAPLIELFGTLSGLPNARRIAEVIHRCLSPEPAQRPSATDVNRVLNDKEGAADLNAPSRKKPAKDRPPTAREARTPVRKKPAQQSPAQVAPMQGVEDEATATLVEDEVVEKPTVEVAATLVLRSEAGVEKAFNVGITIGQDLLRTFGTEDYKFVDKAQFMLEKAAGAWYAVPRPGVKNDTILNGRALVSRTQLKSGDVLAVGRAATRKFKMPLTVSFR